MYDNAREGAAQDYQKAAELYSKACRLGNGAGCSNLGFAYANGRGLKQYYAKASEFYVKACDMGNGGGYYNLGNLYAQKDEASKRTQTRPKNTSKKRAIWSPS